MGEDETDLRLIAFDYAVQIAHLLKDRWAMSPHEVLDVACDILGFLEGPPINQVSAESKPHLSS